MSGESFNTFLSVSSELESILAIDNTNLLDNSDNSQGSCNYLEESKQEDKTYTTFENNFFEGMEFGSFLDGNIFEDLMEEQFKRQEPEQNDLKHDDAFYSFISQLAPIQQSDTQLNNDNRRSRAYTRGPITATAEAQYNQPVESRQRAITRAALSSLNIPMTRQQTFRNEIPLEHSIKDNLLHQVNTFQQPNRTPSHPPPHLLSLDLHGILEQKNESINSRIVNQRKSAPTTPRDRSTSGSKSPRSKSPRGLALPSPRSKSPRGHNYSPHSPHAHKNAAIQTLDQLVTVTSDPTDTSRPRDQRPKSTDQLLSLSHALGVVPNLKQRPLSANFDTGTVNNLLQDQEPPSEPLSATSKLEKTLKVRKGRYRRSAKVHGYEGMVQEFKFN
ncbi:DNA-binding protein RFX7 [Acrasis kona]|uniref:DNA-binding protein RFX7 n=1 Tax=Acrasis kona TaxID=1008807 RepID=A0AAW2YNC7_9EUKA